MQFKAPMARVHTDSSSLFSAAEAAVVLVQLCDLTTEKGRPLCSRVVSSPSAVQQDVIQAGNQVA